MLLAPMAKKSSHGSKAAFVRSMPKTMKAAEIVKRAAAKGIKINVNYIYILRTRRGIRAARAPQPASPRARGTPESLHARIETLAQDFGRKIALAAIDDVVAALRAELQ